MIKRHIVHSAIGKLSPFYVMKILSSFSIQIVSLYLVYLLTPGEYGSLSLIVTISQLMYIFTTGWTDSTIINLGTKEFAEKGSYKNILYYRSIIVIVSFAIITTLFVVLKNSVTEFVRGHEYYWFAYILYLGYILQGFSYQLLYPCGKNMIQSSVELIIGICIFVVVFFFVRSIEGYVYLNAIAYLIYFIIILVCFHLFFGRSDFSWSNSDFVSVFKFSYWQIIGVAGIYIINIGVNYVFSILHIDISQIGLYNFAYKLFSGFTPVFAICVVTIPQWLYNYKGDGNILAEIDKKIIWGIVALSVAYIVLSLFLKPFIILIEKVDYIESVEYFMFLFPAFIFMCYCQLIGLVIMTTSFYKHIQYATLIQGLSLLIYSFVFIYYMGVIGAILAVTFSFLTKSIYLYILYLNKVRGAMLRKLEER